MRIIVSKSSLIGDRLKRAPVIPFEEPGSPAARMCQDFGGNFFSRDGNSSILILKWLILCVSLPKHFLQLSHWT
ncbi:hypothetical protein, partial [Alkalibacterium sp. m-11]